MKCSVCNRPLTIESDATAMSYATEESAVCVCGYVWEWAYGAEREWFGFVWVYEWGWRRRLACLLWRVVAGCHTGRVYMCKIIAIGHRPPGGKLRIVSLNGGIMSKVGLENIKAGDKVGLYRSRDRRWIEATIDRVTATQVVVQGKRFRIKDGYEIASGSNWYRDHVAALDHEEGWNDKTTIAEQIEQGKIEAVEQERRAKAIKTIYAQGWRDLSTETLEAIVAILDKAK